MSRNLCTYLQQEQIIKALGLNIKTISMLLPPLFVTPYFVHLRHLGTKSQDK
jgi:hypothetical protein